AVGSAAPKLRGEFQFGDFSPKFPSPSPQLGRASNIEQRDALVVVDKEDSATRRIDDLLDLVVALVAVKAALFIEAVGFVRYQDVEFVCLCVNERTGAVEETAVSRIRSARELGLVHLARSRVLRNVPRIQPLAVARRQEANRNN